ncbi:MAG: TIGR03643 family protein [Candidatus Marinimicrobia bacterium]|nr:TIGR03643 family protein [Candidatus Neomarinimicrobiota bacterium]|tara:strand:+ start:32 stop:286 length:255 start_codon:yes stop_codon:yes gene_type:complete
MVNQKKFSDNEINRIIEMAWEDRTPFEAIQYQFGINQDGVIKIMRENLKTSSFKLWRKRTSGRKTKHKFISNISNARFKSKNQK